MAPSGEVRVVRVRGDERRETADRVAVEEPLEIRLQSRPFAVIMRTPGHDRELAAGFLLAERIIGSADDLGVIEHCRDAAAAAGNVVNVVLAPQASHRVERAFAGRRHVAAHSSCGLCGRVTIESLRADVPPLEDDASMRAAIVVHLPDSLREAQPLFDATGGIHAAGLFRLDGSAVTTAEDVGRHNAVDKVIGRMWMLDQLPLAGRALFVSGRTSLEIVQKAWFAGIPIVASVSAPSSLAIDIAREAGITLVGFVREDRFNIYSHPDRVT